MSPRLFGSHPAGDSPDQDGGILTPRRIVVPVRGGPQDKEALRAACRLGRPARADILVITVLEVSRNLPLSASLNDELGRAEEVLAEMEAVAAGLGAHVRTTVLQAREAGPAIVDEARRWGADLMVVGLGINPRFGEFSVGRTGARLLSDAHCRLVLLRQALPEDLVPPPVEIT
jgi:nucleotide-binding universal stress UspA family protein